jgi:RNA polymerase sigma-70 factor, ECF subfamily
MVSGGSTVVFAPGLFDVSIRQTRRLPRRAAVLSSIAPDEDANDKAESGSDAALLAAATRRDAEAYATLVARYQIQVYRVVWRLSNGHADTEDMTQEVFLRLWRNPGQLREVGALKGWLMRVASNLVMDRYRAKPMQDIESAEHVDDGRPSAEDELARNWTARRIDAAVAALPDRQKLAMTLVHFEQQGNIKAASIMGVSVDALESLLARARRSLKLALATDKDLLFAGLTEERHRP